MIKHKPNLKMNNKEINNKNYNKMKQQLKHYNKV